jgi:hypothetical protein
MSRSLDKDPLYQNLLFSLPMREGTGTAVTADVAKPHHPVTQVHAPAWTQLSPSGLWVLGLDGANDHLTCAAASCADLNFTSSDFSLAAWVLYDTLPGTATIFYRGKYQTDGWSFYMTSGWGLVCTTNQAGASQASYSSLAWLPAAGSWFLASIARSGTSVRVYIDGRDRTSTAATHSDPTTASRTFYVGVSNGGASGFLDGLLWGPRIWSRALSPAEHMELFNRERGLFGV